jgi:transposase-like protein
VTRRREEWGDKYAAMVRLWRNAWEEFTPFLVYDVEIGITRGLELDRPAVNAALTQSFHNGWTEGVNTKTKLIKRQMYGRAGFTLLRHRILLS